MKKKICVLILLSIMLVFVCLPVSAQLIVSDKNEAAIAELSGRGITASGKCAEDTDWILYDDGELFISGQGYNGFSSIPWNGYYNSSGKWVDSPYKGLVKSLVIKGVAKLDADKTSCKKTAFESMPALKSINIDIKTGVSCIGWTLCTDLFKNCASLETVFVGGKSVTFNSGAFNGCTSLKSLTLPSYVETKSTRYISGDVEDFEAFSGCSNLSDIYYPGSRTVWSKRVKIVTSNGANSAFVNAVLHPYHTYLPYSTISTEYNRYAYTGKAVTPKVTVKTVSGTTLKKGKNYTVSYEDNKDYGTASITVKGIGKYYGEYTMHFSIVPGKVHNLIQTGADRTSATISWDEHPYASKYEVRLRGPYGQIVGNTTSTNYTITGLSSAVSVYVRAVVTKTDPITGKTTNILGNAAGTYVVLNN